MGLLLHYSLFSLCMVSMVRSVAVITDIPENYYVGDHVSLTCNSTGYDVIAWYHGHDVSDTKERPIDQWYKDTRNMEMRDAPGILTNNEQTLNFQAKRSDTGIFTCVMKNVTSAAIEEIILRLTVNECSPQKPAVVTGDGGDNPLVTCSNNGTVATLSCYVNFHCAGIHTADLVWVAYFDQRRGYPLSSESRYKSTTYMLDRQGYRLMSVLEVTGVTGEDFDREYKCAVVTEYDYDSTGDRIPDIRGRLCEEGIRSLPQTSSAMKTDVSLDVLLIGSILLVVLHVGRVSL